MKVSPRYKRQYMLDQMAGAAWRVAVTRDDKGEDSVSAALERAGFSAVPVPILVEGPAPDARQLIDAARELESFDWIICASQRAVRAISRARGSPWPAQPRTAAVGPVTAEAMRDAGAADPIVAERFTAEALWEKLQRLDAWRDRRVLVTTIAGGRREVIDGLRSQGAAVTELEAYSMHPRPLDDIRHDWTSARPDAVIVGSAESARRLVDAVGIATLHDLEAIVPIGPTTADVLSTMGIEAEPPSQATFVAAVEKLRSVARLSRRRSR
jgi:uroporphyrinogen-III synthase